MVLAPIPSSMPTYEYRCTACGHQFDLFQRMSDEPGADCPECSGAAERLLSGGAGFLFKGDGFYITDYRSKSYKDAASKDSGGSGSASEAKTSSGTKSGESSSGSSTSSSEKAD